MGVYQNHSHAYLVLELEHVFESCSRTGDERLQQVQIEWSRKNEKPLQATCTTSQEADAYLGDWMALWPDGSMGAAAPPEAAALLPLGLPAAHEHMAG